MSITNKYNINNNEIYIVRYAQKIKDIKFSYKDRLLESCLSIDLYIQCEIIQFDKRYLNDGDIVGYSCNNGIICKYSEEYDDWLYCIKYEPNIFTSRNQNIITQRVLENYALYFENKYDVMYTCSIMKLDTLYNLKCKINNVNLIKYCFRRAITDPEYKLCRDRLLREFDTLIHQ